MRRLIEFNSQGGLLAAVLLALVTVLALPQSALADSPLISAPTGSVAAAAAPPYIPGDALKTPDPSLGPSPPPPLQKELEDQTANTDPTAPNQVGLQIRAEALREAALSYGARGGLAFRTFEIQRRLAEYDTSLSKAFNFARLLVAAPSGLMIEPPVVTEAQRAVLVNSGGQAAAIADRVYRVNRIARIVTTARDWRLYLERDWGRVDPPPSILLPREDYERADWVKYVREGWKAGTEQAEDTFEADLDRLTNDFVGMVRYRELLAQGMISAPYAQGENRGVTGGGKEMRVGDRGVSITSQSVLNPRSDQWTPAPR